MGFQLWIHDQITSGPEVKHPILPKTPTTYYSPITTIFKAGRAQRMRIHFFCKPGTGTIFVSEFTVHEIVDPSLDISKL